MANLQRRVRFYAPNGTIMAAEIIEADNDRDAINRAYELNSGYGAALCDIATCEIVGAGFEREYPREDYPNWFKPLYCEQEA